MAYIVMDQISYYINGAIASVNKNAKLSEETALQYFKTQGVIDGLVQAGRLKMDANAHAEKAIDKVKSIANSITNKMADFATK